ncbi:MAG: hypothetical protein ACJATN_000800 [Neolewinella sp.]|jgi:hypothetical protein
MFPLGGVSIAIELSKKLLSDQALLKRLIVAVPNNTSGKKRKG